MDKHNFSNEALEDIAGIMSKYLNNQINPASIYKYEEFTSFGQHSDLLSAHVGISYYSNKGTFHGNVDGGGHFSGTIHSGAIYISCSQTSNSITIPY